MIEVGTKVQYRKVGIAVVTEVLERTERSAMVHLAFETGPKAYRPGGRLANGFFWIGNSDVVR